MRTRSVFSVVAVSVAMGRPGAPGSAAPVGPDFRVSVGSPSAPFSQNKQNERALAVDAHHPHVLVAGANDEIDMEACYAGADDTCPFTPGVGVSAGTSRLIPRHLEPADLSRPDRAYLPGPWWVDGPGLRTGAGADRDGAGVLREGPGLRW